MVSLVVPVGCGDGSRAVLKLQPLDEEKEGEPVALRAWDGRGMVRLLKHDAASGTMLLERLDEGRHLSSVGGEASVEGVSAALLTLPA
jgi:streptomycin 6-kinase